MACIINRIDGCKGKNDGNVSSVSTGTQSSSEKGQTWIENKMKGIMAECRLHSQFTLSVQIMSLAFSPLIAFIHYTTQ